MRTRFHKTIGRKIRRVFRRKVLSRHGVGVLADTKNGLFVVDPGDFMIGRKLLRDGVWDYDEISWLSDVVGENAKVIVNVGTHIGALLIPLSKLSERTIGFEANAQNYKLAVINSDINRLTNTTIENLAIGEQERVVSVVNNPINTGNSSINLSSDHGEMTVKMTTLDKYCSTHQIDSIDLMVMDIEGHELYALLGGEKCLKATRAIYIEFAPEHLREQGTQPEDLVDRLCDLFDHMYIFEDKVRSYDSVEARDYLKAITETRGLLKNLLFTKEVLPNTALQRTR